MQAHPTATLSGLQCTRKWASPSCAPLRTLQHAVASRCNTDSRQIVVWLSPAVTFASTLCPQDRPSLDALLRMEYIRHHVQRYARHVLQLGSTSIPDLGLQEPTSAHRSKHEESADHHKDPESTTPNPPALQHPSPQLAAKKSVPPVTQTQKARVQATRPRNLVLAPDLVPAKQKLNPCPKAISESSVGGASRRGPVVGVRNSAGNQKASEAR